MIEETEKDVEINTFCWNCKKPTNTNKTNMGTYICDTCGIAKRVNQHKSVYPTLKEFALFLLVGVLTIIGVISIVIWVIKMMW